MARTDVETVKSIMTTALTDTQITNIITIANRVVTNVLGSSGLASDVLKDIETYFAAHLIATGKERQVGEEKVGDIWLRYQGQYGKFLEATSFGQFVLMLDTSGNMARQTKTRAKIRAIQQDSDDLSEVEDDEW